MTSPRRWNGVLVAGLIAMLGIAGVLVWTGSPDDDHRTLDTRDAGTWPQERATGTRGQTYPEEGPKTPGEETPYRATVESSAKKAAFESHGPLEPELKNMARQEMMDSLAAMQRQLGRAVQRAAAGEPDLIEEANVAIAMRQRRAQLELLESDDYITVDRGIRLFDSAPDGYSVITYLVRRPDSQGRNLDAVFVIDHERFPEISAAREGKRDVEHIVAAECVLAFNAMDYELRRESLDVRQRLSREGRDAESAEEKAAMGRFGAVFMLANRGVIVDEATCLLTLR